MRVIVIVGLAAVVTALVAAGVFLYRDRGQRQPRDDHAGIRVLLSARWSRSS
jgi:hypothetical protein